MVAFQIRDKDHSQRTSIVQHDMMEKFSQVLSLILFIVVVCLMYLSTVFISFSFFQRSMEFGFLSQTSAKISQIYYYGMKLIFMCTLHFTVAYVHTDAHTYISMHICTYISETDITILNVVMP